jgi:Ran GTPase-activating protein (RanGAP) involved in mRNA processing and transport
MLDDYYEEVKNGGPMVYFDDRQIGDEGATQVANALMDPNTEVQVLYLLSNNIGDVGATAIGEALLISSPLQRLWKLLSNKNIEGESVTSAPTAVVEAWKEATEDSSTLHILYMGSNNIRDEGAMALGEALKFNSTLKELSLDDNNIGLEMRVSW